MSIAAPGACDERFVRFGAEHGLVGVVSEPPRPADRPPVVVLGAGLLHRSGPSRAVVALARALAARGHVVLRFDLTGIGDSPLDGRRSLRDAVLSDIRAAIDLVSSGGDRRDVILAGFCSGADNAFAYAASDARIGSLVLFDPMVHPTFGHWRRTWWRRLTSRSAWRTLLSGRLWRRPLGGDATFAPPPEYFSMLVVPPGEADTVAAAQATRGVRRLFLLTSGVQQYCSAAAQVRESLPTGYRAEHDTVVWAPHVDHVLSRPEHVDWFIETVARFAGGVTASR